MSEDIDNIPSPEDTTEEAISPAPSAGSKSDPLLGTKIGSCTLKRIIGSGGMGTVYEAVQENPRRRVALKMMKRGITSRSATRRFEFESQTLARLQHPGVAQIYEAGTHDDGSGGVPYFVMEYVASAKPITQYANDKKLVTKDRLALFSKVCDAVQHGHVKGIVHRDLKPGNILVDASGQPKVIDFGVARSTDSDLAVTTLQTDVGQLIGTLQYMSPEQCEADPMDIDARSDVYALGVILYELLTDKPPYNLQRMAIHEAVRIVREEEPTKLSTIDRHLRGDIETIAMKALEKDRDRRYQSATALEEDIQHYLSDEPIRARPPGVIDYLQRFARKHTAAAIAIATVFMVLVVAVVAISIYAVKAERQRVVAEASQQEAIQEKTRAEAVKDFVTTMLSSVDPTTAGAMDKELMMLVLSKAAESVGKQFEDQQLVEAEIRNFIGTTYYALGKYDETESHLIEALAINRRILGDEHSDTLALINNMGNLLLGQGKYDEAEVYLREAQEIRRRVLGDEHPDTLRSIYNMGNLLYAQGKYDEAVVYHTEVVEIKRRVLGDDHPDTLASINSMGALLQRQGKYDEAEVYLREALETRRRVLGDEHPETLTSIRNIGYMLQQQGKYDEAEPYVREALETSRRVLGDEHPGTLSSIGSMGSLLMQQDKYDEAEPYIRESLETRRRVLGDEHPSTQSSINNMGNLLADQGKYDEAEVYYTEALETSRRILGDEHQSTLHYINNMGALLQRQGKYDEAEVYYTEALKGYRRVLGDEHPSTLGSIGNMGVLLKSQGKYDEAEVYYLDAVEGYRRVLGDEHPYTLKSINALIKLYNAWGKPEEAQKYRDMLPEEDAVTEDTDE